MEDNFDYPLFLDKDSEMLKNAKRIESDSAIFGERRALLEKHFNEAPIYLNESYYTNETSYPRVKKNDHDYTGSCYTTLSNWPSRPSLLPRFPRPPTWRCRNRTSAGARSSPRCRPSGCKPLRVSTRSARS